MTTPTNKAVRKAREEPAVRHDGDAATPLSNEWADKYNRLRELLKTLWMEPVKNMPAIADVMQQLDDAHAAFKAHHKTDDHQRY